jgi:hypothetical protein
LRRGRIAHALALFVAGLVIVLGGMPELLIGSAAAAAPGFQRLQVPDGGFSLRIPIGMDVTHPTREEATRVLEATPRLKEEGGITVDSMMASDFTGISHAAGGLIKGGVSVRVSPRAQALPTPAQMRAYKGSKRILHRTAKQTSVANQPALVTTNTVEETRTGGVVTEYEQTYFFLGPSNQLVIILFHRMKKNDYEFAVMTQDMLDSIKIIRS